MFFPIAHLPPDVQENMFKRLNEYRKKEEERLAKERKNNLIKQNMEKAKLQREEKLRKEKEAKEEKEKFNELKRKELMEEMVKNPPSTFSAIMAYGNLFSYFSDKTFASDSLPHKVFAYTPCFRSEAGSWGKDVKGIKRVHQFDKIEMNAICLPDQSESIYQEFSEINEWLLQKLRLPYRVVDKCTGDAGYLASFRQKDLEVWLSGSCEYMEVMTDTNTTDYQARRLGIRYRADKNRGFCHTVNDTGAAMGRLIIAILDNYQQKDGSVLIPEILQKSIGKTHLVPNL